MIEKIQHNVRTTENSYKHINFNLAPMIGQLHNSPTGRSINAVVTPQLTPNSTIVQ